MSSYNAKLQELAAKCRRSHAATLVVLGYLVLDLDERQLEDLLVAVDEAAAAWTQPTHLVAYEERWGVRPG